MNKDLLEWWDGGAAARDGAPDERPMKARSHARSRSLPFPNQAATPPRPASGRARRRQHGHSRQPQSAADIAAAANRRANRAVPRGHVRAASSPSASEHWTRPLTLDDLVGLGVYGLDSTGAPARAHERAAGGSAGLRAAPDATDGGDERQSTSHMMRQLRDSRRRVQKTHQAARVVRARHAAIFPKSGEWQR